MPNNATETYVDGARKASEAGRTLQQWQKDKPTLEKRMLLEKAGQGTLDL